MLDDLKILRWNIAYIRTRNKIERHKAIDKVVIRRTRMINDLKFVKDDIDQVRKLKKRIRRYHSFQTNIQKDATLSMVQCKAEVNEITMRLFSFEVYHNPTYEQYRIPWSARDNKLQVYLHRIYDTTAP